MPYNITEYKYIYFTFYPRQKEKKITPQPLQISERETGDNKKKENFKALYPSLALFFPLLPLLFLFLLLSPLNPAFGTNTSKHQAHTHPLHPTQSMTKPHHA